MKRITYKQLANKVGDMVMCNNINSTDENWYEHILQGHEEPANWDEEKDGEWQLPEIYQSYIITDYGARQLLEHTNEIVAYNPELSLFVWHVTHWGTPWSGVYLDYNEDAYVSHDDLLAMIKHF